MCDDNAASLEWIAQVLHDAGYRVLVDASATGCLAREEVARGEIDLLLTDVRMAPIDGPTLAAELRERMGSLPCVFMSGFTANLLTGLREEDTLLDKPFTRAQLLSALARALREGR